MKIALLKKLLAELFNNNPCPHARIPDLADVAAQARREWLDAQNYFNVISDTDLVDYAIYLMQAAEKKYIYLLKKARQEGVTHFPFQ
ncbi:MAG TPA: DUF2508 family protein [Negativicutes bacterium]|nr:DUF2508 family protein [Negativicutes bacterium]